MKCQANCRCCAWAGYFFDDGLPPFALRLTPETPDKLDMADMETPDKPDMETPDKPDKPAKPTQSHLFMNPIDRTLALRNERDLCDSGEHRFFDIRWEHYQFDWTLNKLKSLCCSIVDVYSSSYVGISPSVCWRWGFCAGHGTMIAHKQRFDLCFPITYEYATPARYIEEQLIDDIRASSISRSQKLDNHINYRPGPLNYGKPHFLYICVCV